MGEFLKAAYEVLRKQQQPLTAQEIARIALREGCLKSSGKTPSQTMKARLSTEILRRGTDSTFMRVERGKFALREWKEALQEHIAQRFKKALYDEEIIVFPAASLMKYVPHRGLHAGQFDSDSFLSECRSMRRRDAEETFAVIQLVSVFIVRYEDKYLTYKRAKRLPESRLHGFYSLSFGGHLNPDDLRPLLNIFNPELASPLLLRELGEELKLDPKKHPAIKYRGLLYDDSRDVSRQHLGITYDVFLPTASYEIGERGFLINAKYETLGEILGRIAEFENWSVLLIEEELRQKESLCSKLSTHY